MANVLNFPKRERVRVVMVRDWRAMTDDDLLRCNVDGSFQLAAARAAWKKWWSGEVHDMPMGFVDKKEFKQYVVLRLAALGKLREDAQRDPGLGIVLKQYPEWWAGEWSEGRVHHSRTFAPRFIPGWHEQQMKSARQNTFWALLEAGSLEAWEWPEGRSLLKEAGYEAGEAPPAIVIQRPHLPLPRRMRTKRERRQYRKLQEKSWQIAYGQTRRMIVKILRRERNKRLLQRSAVA